MFIQDAKERWSETLWVDLNIESLNNGIDGFIKLFRKIPRNARKLQSGEALDKRMKDFRYVT